MITLNRSCFLLSLTALAACGARSVGADKKDGGRADGTIVVADSAANRDGGPLPDGAVTRDGAVVADAAVADGWDPAEVARACVLAASCQPWRDQQWQAFRPSACVDWFARADWPQGGYAFGPSRALLQRLLDCARAHTPQLDCGRFVACYGGNWFSPNMCREYATCEGTRLVNFDEGSAYFECSTVGAACMDLPTGAPRACCAGAGSCGGDEVTCRGAAGTGCVLGIPFDFDCGPTGRLCSTDGDEFCQGTGAACEHDDPVQCAGSVASYCSSGQLAMVDCAKNPLRSACGGTTWMPCGPAGGACNEEFVGACRGPDARNAVVCVDGREVAINCRSLGFDACRADRGACMHYVR